MTEMGMQQNDVVQSRKDAVGEVTRNEAAARANTPLEIASSPTHFAYARAHS